MRWNLSRVTDLRMSTSCWGIVGQVRGREKQFDTHRTVLYLLSRPRPVYPIDARSLSIIRSPPHEHMDCIGHWNMTVDIFRYKFILRWIHRSKPTNQAHHDTLQVTLSELKWH